MDTPWRLWKQVSVRALKSPALLLGALGVGVIGRPSPSQTGDMNPMGRCGDRGHTAWRDRARTLARCAQQRWVALQGPPSLCPSVHPTPAPTQGMGTGAHLTSRWDERGQESPTGSRCGVGRPCGSAPHQGPASTAGRSPRDPEGLVRTGRHPARDLVVHDQDSGDINVC